MGKLEKIFQSELIKELRELFPGCIILKNDPTYIQGIPDLLILFEDKWAALEVKKSVTAYTEEIDGEVVTDINKLTGRCIIAGVDLTEKLQKYI